MDQTIDQKVPDRYSVIDHHDYLDLYNEQKNIVITIHELEPFQNDWERFDYRVIGAQNQQGFYDGTFDSLSHAEDKVLELARKH